MAEQPRTEFEKAADEDQGGNLLIDFWHFLRHNKKWWLIPLLLILLLLSALMLISSSGIAPLIYTFF